MALLSSCNASLDQVESGARSLGYPSDCRSIEGNMGAMLHYCEINNVPDIKSFAKRIEGISSGAAKWKGYIYQSEAKGTVFEFSAKHNSACYSATRFQSGNTVYSVTNSFCGSPSSDANEVPVPF